MSRLPDKVAIVTGGARGIGKTAVSIFAKEGARVVIWDVLEEGREAAATLREAGLTVEFEKLNTRDFAEVEAAAERVYQRFGKIDILINNAGITRDQSFLKMTHEQFQEVVDVNLYGVFNCTKAVAPYMKTAGYGRIISTSSIVALYGNFGQTNYVATKAGVIGMTKVWARELGKYGITANAVAPGFIHTEMTMAIPEEIRAGAAAQIPVKRLGMPEDIAYAYLYLASDEASFVNGICLSVDGGAVG
jgi:3-oxoacyl-[acyl-carrier protein] reductase